MNNKDIEALIERNEEYQREILNLQGEVSKWTRYCASVAGVSLGIILFTQVFAGDPTSEPVVCPEPEECPEPEACPECAVCPTCPEVITQTTPSTTPSTTIATKPTTVEPNQTFPQEYTIQSGDSFGKIAQKFYKRASLGDWLAKQNNIDPSKLQIGKKITIPVPPPQ